MRSPRDNRSYNSHSIVSVFWSPAFLCPRATPSRFRHKHLCIRLVPYSGKPAGTILRSSSCAGPAFTDASPRFAGTPEFFRASTPATAAQCSTTFQAWSKSRWLFASLTSYEIRDSHNALGCTVCTLVTAAPRSRSRRGCWAPCSRDGGGVQLFYGTVIILRMIYCDINFVVELSDKRKSGKGLILFLRMETQEVDITLCIPIILLSAIPTRQSTNRFHPVMFSIYSCQHNRHIIYCDS